jgi:hypothetical protein
MGQTGVLRACLATRPFRGLGFVEASTREIHQGWEGSSLPEKAEYMSATEPSLVLTTNHLAMGVRSIYVASFQLRGFPVCSSTVSEVEVAV